jgi:hypothetical protein
MAKRKKNIVVPAGDTGAAEEWEIINNNNYFKHCI